MKVLLLFSTGELGGAERSLSRMALTSHKTTYQLATLGEEGPWSQWIRLQGTAPLVFGTPGGGRLKKTIQPVMGVCRYLRRHPFDAVYVCGARASLFLRLFRWLLPKTRIINGVRWNPDSNTPLDRFFRITEFATHFLADAWITNSAVTKQTLIRRCKIPSRKIFVIYNGLDSPPVSSPSQTLRPKEVLTVANLNPRKGHREYLEVIRQVSEAVPGVRFVFVGRDDMGGAFQKAVKDAGLGGVVRYEGFKENVSPWFARARLFVLPSLWGEGCPTSILESFSHGVPVVAYAIDGIPELVTHGEDGLLVRPFHQKTLSDHIIELLKAPDRAQTMGNRGRLKTARSFTLAQCVSRHDTAMETILGGNA